ncbi:protein of unknown function [Candidatus Methylomirabilis oxygeniifera]|uniref:Uncharacterized protein n=1 Tax=Methylomirabilis oxygeniifera TaxID=671143 RepID=D5MMX3_METO1|nr:protein of unknown function [Candidatus Methylomirabilis oxyfera]
MTLRQFFSTLTLTRSAALGRVRAWRKTQFEYNCLPALRISTGVRRTTRLRERKSRCNSLTWRETFA